MIIRPYQPEDCEALARLFYETVHTVNAKDYTEQQLNAWATGAVDLEAWDRSLTAHFTLVAEENGRVWGHGSHRIPGPAVRPQGFPGQGYCLRSL